MTVRCNAATSRLGALVLTTNNDGKVDAAEFNAATNATFTEIDRTRTA